MKIRFYGLAGLYFAVLLVFVLAFNLAAKDKTQKQSNIQGRVQMIDKDSNTITVEKGTVRRQVVVSPDTKFMYGHSNDNKPSSLDQIKEGHYISCSGMYSDKTKLTAKECLHRETK
jgi:hypothetical protein